MIRALGGIMLLMGGTLMGRMAAARLSARVKTIGEMRAAVQVARREIAFSLLPVPELLKRMGAESEKPLKEFFVRCGEALSQLERRSLEEIWRVTLEQAELPVRHSEKELFASLGAVLGRYDQSGQEEALEFLQKELEESRIAAEEEQRRLGKVYQVLGVTAGGFLLVLLL